MSLGMYIALYFELLKKIVDWAGDVNLGKYTDKLSNKLKQFFDKFKQSVKKSKKEKTSKKVVVKSDDKKVE